MPHDPRSLAERQALALDKFDRYACVAIHRGDALADILKMAQAHADVFLVDRGELIAAWSDLQDRRKRGLAPHLQPVFISQKADAREPRQAPARKGHRP